MTTMNIPIARPYIGEEEIAAVTKVMRSGMLAQGEVTAEFERTFAEYCGTKYAVAVNSGTAALHAALLAAGIGPGDEVIVPAFTFFATASSVSMCGAKPVFADVDRRTFNIDSESAAACISKKTKAVVGVHLFGQPFDVAPLQEICTDHRLALIEDAAQAHGATYKGKKVGGLGFAGCFSFYATKNMLTGEGGMITTDDRTAADRMRLFINHGQSQKYLHTVLGYNFRLTDMASAIGLVQLRRLDEMNARRAHNAAYFDRCIKLPECAVPYRMPDATHVYHQYVLTLGDAFPRPRAELMTALKERGIGTAVHYPIPLHRQPLYEASGSKERCPVASLLSERVLSLPVHPQVSDAELSYICKVLPEVI